MPSLLRNFMYSPPRTDSVWHFVKDCEWLSGTHGTCFYRMWTWLHRYPLHACNLLSNCLLVLVILRVDSFRMQFSCQRVPERM